MNSRFDRNLGFLSIQEQEKLQHSTVAIAGAGGDGGMLAVQLARLGVGSFRLADPDAFEEENINRQAVCTDRTIGLNKAKAVGAYIMDINPDARVDIYDQGITRGNVAEFVKNSDLLIDETEFSLHSLAVMLAREARSENIPNMTALNIGFGSIVTTYHPKGVTVENRLGFGDTQDIDEIEAATVPLSRWLPYIPKYGDIAVLEKVTKGEKPAPSIAPGVAIAAGMGATQALLNLVGSANNRKKPIYAPRAIVIDVMSLDAKTIGYNRLSHYRYLAKMVLKNSLKKVPKASY